MKYTFYLVLIFSFEVIGQNKSAFSEIFEPCNCLHKSFEKDSLSFSIYDNNKAQKQVNEYLGLIQKYLPENEKGLIPRIITKHEDCIGKRIAVATKCPDNNFKYIYYNNKIFEKIDASSKSAIDFILAHEIGHHLFNHFHNNAPLSTVNEISKSYIYKSNPCKSTSCNEIRNKHLQELEADFIAVWILKKMKVDREEFNELFDVIKIKGEISETGISSTHPSIVIRKQHAQKAFSYFETIKNNDLLIKGKGFADGEYDEILYNLKQDEIDDLNEFEKKMINLHKLSVESINLRYLGDSLAEVGDFGTAIQKLNESLKKLKQSYYYSEKDSLLVATSIANCQQILAKKNIFTISPILSYGYSINSFLVDNVKLNTANKQFGSAGFRLSLLKWDKKSWFESELVYAYNTFDILANQNGIDKILETFRLNSLNLSTCYSFNTIGNKNEILNWGKGITVVVGPRITYYLPSNYINYYSNTELHGRYFKPRIGPHFEVGLEGASRKKSLSFKNYRISFAYDLQKMQFNSDYPIRENIDLMNHNISIKLSYRQW